MSTFGSDDLKKSFLRSIDDGDELPKEFCFNNGTESTKRIKISADDNSSKHQIHVSIKDKYISVKYNISDGESVINVKQKFFDKGSDAGKWVIETSENIVENSI